MNTALLMRGFRRACLVAAILSSPIQVVAQENSGRIVGRVISAQTGEPVVNAQVFLADRSQLALSNIDGRYLLRNVPAGSHSVTVQSIGFSEKTVTEIPVARGQTAVIDIPVDLQAVELEGLTISAAAQRGSTVALTTDRQRASVTQDAIGADQISRSPDGDAGAALKRVPGLSVVDGKYAYVRGLGERYSQTTLNGAPLASPVPDKKVIPLDVIPSSLLESIVTQKSFSPDQPGDYAGGLVALRTKKFPNTQLYSIAVSGGMSDNGTFENGLSYVGGGTDWLGIDDGTRELPSSIPADRSVRFGNFTRAELETIGEGFLGSSWGPILDELGPNTGLGLTYGNAFDVGDRQLGLLASATLSNGFDRKTDIVERVFSTSGIEDPEVDYSGDITTRNVSVGGLFNLAFDLSSTHQIKFEGVYNRLTEDVARVFEGFNLDSNTNQRNSRIQYIEQELVNAQLAGEHQFGGLGNLGVNWRGAYTRASRYEPNTREVLYREFDGSFIYDDFIQSGSVFHQDLVDSGYNGALDLTIPLEFRDRPARLKFGGAGSVKDRETLTRRFRFRPVGPAVSNEVRQRDPDDLFTAETIGPDGFEIQEATFRTDNYTASEDVYAGYGMADFEIFENVRLVAGARWESSEQIVTPRDFEDLGLPALEGANLDETNILPSVNLTVTLGDDMNLRAGFSKTLARPQLRELAPFSFADYAGGYLQVGNPLLGLTTIYNYDARWEWFAAPGALIAVSGFYKEFLDPIEVLVLPSTELIRTWVNVGDATNYGAEIELRSSLEYLSESLSDLSVNANVTLVESDVSSGGTAHIYLPGEGEFELDVLERQRPLQGQSPYVFNAGVTYAPLSGGTTASVLFNRFGRRIDAVGRESTPDIYEEARSQLDITLEQELANGVSVKFSASRLVGNIVEFTQGDGLLRQWDSGRTFSLSFSWGN